MRRRLAAPAPALAPRPPDARPLSPPPWVVPPAAAPAASKTRTCPLTPLSVTPPHTHTHTPFHSLDILPDALPSHRTAFPHTIFLAAGTQAADRAANTLTLMRLGGLGQGRHGDRA